MFLSNHLRRGETSTRSTPARRAARPRFESLESRQLLSGSTFADSGFENVVVGSGNFRYNPTDTGAWTFSPQNGNNGSGVTGNNSGFTSGNPSAPQGSQVAFLQGQSSISGSLSGLSTGNLYSITIDAAQRGNKSSSQSIELDLNGSTLALFTPSSTSYLTYTTQPFRISNPDIANIVISGKNNNGDNTALIDDVTVNATPVSPTPTGLPDPPTVADFGFEHVVVGRGNYQYNPTDSGAWTFSPQNGNNGSGVTGNNSGFTSGDPSAPQGSQVAFLQGNGYLSEPVAFSSDGNYQVSFSAAQRYHYSTNDQTFDVLVDGSWMGSFQPTRNTYSTYTSGNFFVRAGTHTITFQGTDTHRGDNTAFLDSIQVVATSTSSASSPLAQTAALAAVPNPASATSPNVAAVPSVVSTGVQQAGSTRPLNSGDAPKARAALVDRVIASSPTMGTCGVKVGAISDLARSLLLD